MMSPCGCPYCGGPIHFIDKGAKGGRILVCDNGRRGVCCKPHRVKYDEAERTILANCIGLKPQEVLPAPDKQTKLVASLRRRVQGNEAKVRDLRERIDNYDDQIGRTGDPERRDSYEARVRELQREQTDIQIQIELDGVELRKAEHSLQSFKRWRADLATLRKALESRDDVELRMQLRAHLRRLIDRIEVYSVGFKELYDPRKDDGIRPGRLMRKADMEWVCVGPAYINKTECIGQELRAEVDPAFASTEKTQGFIQHLIQRRMSKEGRFFRVHFNTGLWVDLVPDGSLASGSRLYIEEETRKRNKLKKPNRSKRKKPNRNKVDKPIWKIISPPVKQLLVEYQQAYA